MDEAPEESQLVRTDEDAQRSGGNDGVDGEISQLGVRQPGERLPEQVKAQRLVEGQVQLLQVLQGAEGVLCQAEDTAVREVEVRDVNQVGQGGCVERDELAVSRLPVHVHVCQLREAGEAAPQGPVGQTVYGQATQAVQVRQSFVWVAQLNVLSPRDVFCVQS